MTYISGKITGTTDYLDRFAKIEDMLRKSGHIPVNPAKVNAQMPPETDYAGYMKMSLAMLDLCDSIYMMKGWQNSHGAWFEWDYARITGKEVIYEK